MADNLTIKKIKNTDFVNRYLDVMYKNENIDVLLSYAVLFLNCEDLLVKSLGYRIILRYSIVTSDYKPLYEAAFNLGLFPICSFIYDKLIRTKGQESFMSEWLEAYIQLASINKSIRTIEQLNLNKFFLKELDYDSCVIAPTSYGKSELVTTLIKNSPNKNICILVPTKSLISQTRRLVYNYLKFNQLINNTLIITHPDMYIDTKSEKNVIAIFTQERLMRCINQFKNLKFDFLVVDEAHELLENNSRSELQALVILSVRKQNSNVRVKYLTPFISNSENLAIKYSEFPISEFKVSEVVKIPRYQYIDLINKVNYIYDQFFNKFIKSEYVESLDSPEDFILGNKSKSKKILVYLNKSKDIEQCALKLASKIPIIKNLYIDEICKALAVQLDGKYNLIKCLQHGILYHHGSMPDHIRAFVEYIYINIPEIKYLVTSSTLLQGMNLPIDELYILDIKKGRAILSPSSFKNLIGRVSRFKDVFDKNREDLSLLESPIFILKSSYSDSRLDFIEFINRVANENKIAKDNIKNKMLKESCTSNDLSSNILDDIVENKFPGTVPNYDRPLLKTSIGKVCAENAFNEFDLHIHEIEMQRYCDYYKDGIDSVGELIEAIHNIFIRFLPESSRSNSVRLKEEAAKRFYKSLLEKRMNNVSYKELISFFVNYWKQKINHDENTIVFVGPKWGNTSINGRFGKQYIDVANLSLHELVNLAIVRIKEEDDFIDYSILRYAELLKAASLIDGDFYLKLKYGSTDKNIIGLIQLGFSPYVARLITNKFSDFVEYNDGIVSGINTGILDELKSISIDVLHRFEIESKL